MLAVVLDGCGGISVEQVPSPRSMPGEALINVRAAGICGTDLQLSHGYMAFRGIPGHEFVGTVSEAVSPADRVLLGARVPGEINIGCHECARCFEGMQRHCRGRRVLGILGRDGAFAEQLTLPVSNLRAVPDSISDEEAVFIEPTAAAFEILDQITVGPAQRALVLGDGRLGLLVGQVLAGAGAAVTVAGRHPDKLEVARRLGLHAVPETEGLPEAPFHLVVEATGRPEGLDRAVAFAMPRGTVVMKSTCAGDLSFDAARVVVNEITLVGSRCGRFEPAIEALAAGRVRVEGMISSRLPLEQGAEGFRAASQPGALKVLLQVAR